MKKLIIMILIINNLYSFDDLNQTSLDMFLFKIGFKSLVSDFENEKNITKNNTKLINDLELKVQSLMDTNSNKKILNNFNTNSNKDEYEAKIKDLESKLNILQNKLNNIVNKNEKTNLKTKKDDNYLSAYVGVNEAKLYKNTSENSKVLKVLYRNETLKLEYCNRYGWCKVHNDNGFIAKYKLKF